LLTVIQALACEIPLTTLRASPYLLEYNDIVKAEVRAYNYNGWSDSSGVNTVGGLIQTEPVKMNQPVRGAFTSYT
jgi:hypothetical protein